MTDVSHLGAVVTIAASNTTSGVPVPLTDFPKDTDPVDVPSITIGGFELGTNGDAITWSEANGKELTLAVIPNTPSHIFLQQLFQQNAAEKGRRPANDVITLVRKLPNGSVLTAQDGKLTEGMPALSQASSGRLKTLTYKFIFGKMNETPPVLAVI